jgi:hypothetical protein
MPKLTVAERLEKIAQRKARDERLEARLKVMQRKAAVRSAAEIARLAVKAGIGHLSAEALYGSFLTIAADAASPDKVAAWEAAGGQELRRPETTAREAAVATFAIKPAAETVTELRRLGFRWNSIFGHYEGRVVLAEVSSFVTEAGGVLTKPPQP